MRRLGEILQQAKLPVILDQFYLEEHQGGPDEGWPQWCRDCVNNSACVLIIASQGWFDSYNKKCLPGEGLGATYEAGIVEQSLYDKQGINTRFRFAILDDTRSEQFPTELKRWHQFHPFINNDHLNSLLSWIANCLDIRNFEVPTVRWPPPIAFEPDLADREKIWPHIVSLFAGQSRERIYLFEGATNLGKSALIKQAVRYAKLSHIPSVTIDFRDGTLDIAGILGQFELDLGKQFLPNFCAQGADKVHLLRKDFRALREPILLIFDTYEAVADNPQTADWLSQQILNEVETSSALCILLAGQKIPPASHAN